MHSYLVTTTIVDDSPRLVLIGSIESYTDHFAEQSRISYYPGYAASYPHGMRVAKTCNIAIIDVDIHSRYRVMQLLSSNPFHTFGANMRHINLHSEFPEIFL